MAAVMCVLAILVGSARLSGAGQASLAKAAVQTPASPSSIIGTTPDYVIGPTDVLSIAVSGETAMTAEVVVRPDGKISLYLLNDVVAAGFTPEQLRLRLTEQAGRFVKAPVVTVIVRQVNNNRAYITGQVGHPGPYTLSGPTTVLQLISLAGGFSDFADRKHVLITRLENGTQRAYSFNYDDVVKRRDLAQNILLKAGDTVVVP